MLVMLMHALLSVLMVEKQCTVSGKLFIPSSSAAKLTSFSIPMLWEIVA